MPEVSRFMGVVIAMFFREHPPAHFDATYGDYEITVTIETGIVEGRFPKRSLRRALEWLDFHRDELLENWERARTRQDLLPIDPLE